MARGWKIGLAAVVAILFAAVAFRVAMTYRPVKYVDELAPAIREAQESRDPDPRTPYTP